MSKKIQLRAAAPHCLSMSPEARATIESGQKAFQERQQALKPAPPETTPPERDGEIVKQAIAAAAEEKRAKLAAEAAYQSNVRKLWPQVAGIPESQVDRLYGQQ